MPARPAVSVARSSASGLDSLRLALRTLRKSPGFAAVAILTMALGIGGTTAFFSVVDAALLRPLPFPQPERLMRLRMTLPAASGTYHANVLPTEADFLTRRSQSFDAFSVQRGEDFTLLGGATPVRLAGASVSPGSFTLMGVTPIIGRAFTAAEENAGEASGVVLISHSMWRARFAGDSAVIGRSLRFTDRIVTVIGVLAPGFHFPYDADVWQPLRIQPGNGLDLLVVGRLRPGATIATARAEMTTLTAELRSISSTSRVQLPVDVLPLRDDLVRGQQGTALLLFAAAALFLLMACANLMSLLSARAVARQRELAIRGALGASRGELVISALGEPVAIAALGAGVALLALWRVGPSLGALVPEILSRQLGFRPLTLNPHVAAFAVSAAVFCALMAALAPALHAGRGDATAVLRSTGAANRSSGHRVLRGLLIGEIALLGVLLLSAGALVEGFVRLSGTRAGFDPNGLLAIEIDPPRSRYDDSLKVAQLVENIRRELTLAPGSRAGVTTVNPVRGTIWGVPVRRAGAAPADAATVNMRLITPGLLDAEGVALLRGRDFTRDDVAGAPVAIVSRRLAEHLWRRDDVTGEQVVRSSRSGASIAMTVVGVADDVDDAGDLHESVYFPFDQLAGVASQGSFWVMARGDPARREWVHDVERAIWRVDPLLAWSDIGTMDAMRFESTARERLGTRLASAFGAFAVLLAALGLTGVMTFILSRRQVEIGVRMALGADAPRIVRQLMGEAMRVALAGIAIGLAAWFVVWPIVMHRVAGLRVPGAGTFSIAVGLIMLVSASASWSVARRAARLDPLVALRRG